MYVMPRCIIKAMNLDKPKHIMALYCLADSDASIGPG
jgi:hypothetical protein